MYLDPTPQERQFRDELRIWLEARAPRDWEARQSAADSMEARFASLRDWQRQVYEAGWAGLSWPKEYGGRSAALMEKAIFTEEMARIGAPPLPSRSAPEAGVAVSIAKAYASDAYREAGDRGIQVQGGMGFTWENNVHLYYKRAKASELMFGDATCHRSASRIWLSTCYDLTKTTIRSLRPCGPGHRRLARPRRGDSRRTR